MKPSIVQRIPSITPTSSALGASSSPATFPSIVISSKEQVQHAGKILDQNLVKDSDFVDVQLLSKHHIVTGDDFFVKKQFVALPDPIFEEYRRLEYKCYMGIFPEIHRAWITIDNKFFIWSYLDGSDFNEYDELDQVIISAGLVKPKPGVFKDYVKYLLVLATPVEVALVALTFNNNNVASPSGAAHLDQQHLTFDSQTGAIYSEMELFATNYIIPSDNVNMIKIVGTQNGRIFMCGKDGCLYELTYEPEEGWFKSKCRKLNHSQSFVGILVPAFLKFTHDDPIIDIVVDDTRNFLYTLSENMTIEVYDLGRDGMGMNKIVSYSKLISDVMRKFPNTNRDYSNMKIISIAPVTSYESKIINLVAISSKGDRLFFSTNATSGATLGSPVLSLMDIKPLSLPKSSLHRRVNEIHECFYKDGAFILAGARSDEVDGLVCVSMERKTIANTYPEYSVPIYENINVINLDNGRTHAIAEIPLYLDPLLVSSDNALNEITVQHIKPPREFVCLSSSGMHLLIKLRPVDFLQQILQQTQPEELLKSFVSRYGEDETCAMCVMLACSPPPYNTITDSSQIVYLDDHQLNRRAEETFFRFGGMPQFEIVSDTRRNFLFNNDIMGGPVSTQDISHSAKHNGLYLYLSRLLRPLWNSPLFNYKRMENEIVITSTRYSLRQLKYMLQALLAVLNFMDRYPHLFGEAQSGHGKTIQDKYLDLVHIKKDEEAKRLEQKSLNSLYNLLKRSYQALLFFFFMTRCDIGEKLTQVPPNRVSHFAEVTFRNLILQDQGEEVMREMVRLVILSGENVETICNELKSCDVFFNQYDLEEYKALNLLERAKVQKDEPLLMNSLEIYKKIAGQINVLVVCKEFQKLGYYSGAVDLALSSAELRDPKNLALEWVKGGKSALDVADQQAYKARAECYNCALGVLEDFIKKRTGLQDVGVESAATSDSVNREKMFNAVIEKMSKSKDPLFHETLYLWLIEHNLSAKLLSLNTPYIEDFLLKQNKHYEELSTYYINNRRFDKAAKVLQRLAETKSSDRDLDMRIQNLTHAINYAKAAQTQDDLLTILQDKLDVARIQKRVLSQIQMLPRTDETMNAITTLNSSLLDLNTLYNVYADPMDLLESRLCILHCARHKDDKLIQELWNELIDISMKNGLQYTEDKIASLGKDLSGIFFPLEFICGQLEKRTLDKQPSDWVIKLMKEKVGIRHLDLYNAYHNLFILLSPGSGTIDDDLSMFAQGKYGGLPNTPQMLIRILDNITRILNDWIHEIFNQTYDSYSAQQTFSSGDIKKDIDEYMSVLDTFNNTKTQEIRRQFSEILRKINK
nr:unnamed protein product [Naegleria fowleri]